MATSVTGIISQVGGNWGQVGVALVACLSGVLGAAFVQRHLPHFSFEVFCVTFLLDGFLAEPGFNFKIVFGSEAQL